MASRRLIFPFSSYKFISSNKELFLQIKIMSMKTIMNY